MHEHTFSLEGYKIPGTMEEKLKEAAGGKMRKEVYGRMEFWLWMTK